jgi:hypothetical protein
MVHIFESGVGADVDEVVIVLASGLKIYREGQRRHQTERE